MGSSDIDLCNGVNGMVEHYNYKKTYGKTLRILPPNDQIKELQTILRDKYVVHIESVIHYWKITL